MLVRELSSELSITNKELISFLRENKFNVSSHNQKITDEMIDLARNHFSTVKEDVLEEEIIEETEVVKNDIKVSTKKFMPEDMILCKSVVPWKLNALGADRRTVYHWEYFGDEEYVKFSDLQAMRRHNIITKPKILIQDSDLLYQWRRELSDVYKHYLNVEYPEEFFDLNDEKFRALLTKAPETLREVIRVTCLSMIKNDNAPSINKIRMIDEILNTCIMEFIS